MDRDKTIRTYKDAVAIVTGGASGIGRAVSEELVRRGSEVVIADLQADLGEEVASNLRSSGGKATAVKTDVRDYPEVERLVHDTVQGAGRLDYMFNNAGIGIGGGVHDFGIDDWNYIVNTNLNGIINGVQAAYKIMLAQGFGHIVNTASIAGLIPNPGGVAYATTKHAIVGLSKSLRAEAQRFGIRVSVFCPGVIRTPILEGGGRFGRMLVEIPPEVARREWEKLKPMAPELFAKKALDAVAGNKAVIVEPSWWKWLWRIDRLSHSFAIALSRKRFEALLKAIAAG